MTAKYWNRPNCETCITIVTVCCFRKRKGLTTQNYFWRHSRGKAILLIFNPLYTVKLLKLNRRHWFIKMCAVTLWYGDSASNTAEENSSVFSLIWMR